MNTQEEINELTGQVVDCAYKIHSALGAGLYEKVYEDCFSYELEKRGLTYQRQFPVAVHYENLVINNAFKIDLLVENAVVVELKSVDKLLPVHQAQIITYLSFTGRKTGLLINFNVPLIKEGIRRFQV